MRSYGSNVSGDDMGESASQQEWLAMTEEARQLVFGADIETICDQLDQLLVLVNKAYAMQEDADPFVSKVRSGIMRLERMGAEGEAVFYTNELGRILKKRATMTKWAIVVGVICLIALAIIGFGT